MRNNTKKREPAVHPPFGCFPLVPVVFFQTGERPATIAEIHRWNSPTHLRHDLLPPSIVCRPCFSTSPPAPSFLPWIIVTISLPHSFPHSPPPSRFHFPDSPPSFPSVGYTTCIPPKKAFPENSQPLSPPFSLPSPPHTYASNKKRKRTAFFQKQSFSA